MLAIVWRKKPATGDLNQWTFYMPARLDSFKAKYDSVQNQLKELSGLDDLLAGTEVFVYMYLGVVYYACSNCIN